MGTISSAVLGRGGNGGRADLLARHLAGGVDRGDGLVARRPGQRLVGGVIGLDRWP